MKNPLTNQTLIFLKALAKNNDRDWFQANKGKYELAKEEFKSFMDLLSIEVKKYDEIEKVKTFRIYRDVRFSKDKSPYKKNLGGELKRAGKTRRGGLYFQVEPNNSFVGGGFWNPVSQDLKWMRQSISSNLQAYRDIVNSEDIQYFGGVQGDAVKTAPKGWKKDDEGIEYIRQKQFLLMKQYDDKEVLQSDFHIKLANDMHKMYSFFDFMTEALVFDENGIERE